MNLKKLFTSGAIVPTVVLTCIGVAVLGTLAFIVRNGIANHGLMPQPAVLLPYHCTGFAVPLVLEFGHGKDVVRLKAGAVERNGTVLNGKLDWPADAPGRETLGFVPPVAVVYDDLKNLRVLDASGTVQTCSRTSN